MTFEELTNHFEGLSYREIAKRIGVAHSQLSYYKDNGIPKGRQAIIELKTNGKLKANLGQQQETTA